MTAPESPLIDDDPAWRHWAAQWRLRADTIYLNHGSFGPPPEPVRAAHREWIDRLHSQPMDFYVRQLTPAWLAARASLADFIGTPPDNLAFTENATFAMNIVADSFPLRPGDEVVLTDHEYEAVQRIWRRACSRAGASPPTIARLPFPFESKQDVVDAIFAQVTDRTRLIVVSHITSATATILPVQQICERARAAGVQMCIDGPHAPAQADLHLDSFDCDYYTASLHKWLCAPFGSGFLYVHPHRHDQIAPQTLSFGTLPPKKPEKWSEEFIWTGTRDPSAYLSVPAAIDFMQGVGLEAFRRRTHHLAQYARRRLNDQTGLAATTPDSDDWYGSMALAQLPPGDGPALQLALFKRFGIEVPIIDFGGQRFVRVSCHLYNDKQQIDQLCDALADLA